jgi:ECF transporter S component (folate family)
MLKRTKDMKDNDVSLFGTWLLSVILVELVITFCLTPFWLQIMYGIPFVVSVSIRVIKACFIIPLEIIIGFPLLKQMDKLYK